MTSKQKEKCLKCKYSYVPNGLDCDVICQYILLEKQRRGCKVEGCTKYEEGKRQKDINYGALYGQHYGYRKEPKRID